MENVSGWRNTRLWALLRAVRDAGEDGLTRAGAARALGVSKSEYLNGLLDDLVRLGCVSMARAEELPRRPVVYRYVSGLE